MQTEQHHLGWQIWRGRTKPMRVAHQHSEIEINLLLSGTARYLFAGQPVALEPGGWVVFWGALPHRLIETNDHTELLWVTLPLADFLGYNLPESLARPVLHGELVRESNPQDISRFVQWLHDWDASREHREIAKLELQARLRRLALTFKRSGPRRTKVKHPEKAVKMAQFVIAHSTHAIGVTDVANEAGLNTNYASELFKDTFGMTVLEYLTQHRVAHAQRLLVTTRMQVQQVAFEAGFGSSSQFYTMFERATGETPLRYRRRLLTQSS